MRTPYIFLNSDKDISMINFFFSWFATINLTYKRMQEEEYRINDPYGYKYYFLYEMM